MKLISLLKNLNYRVVGDVSVEILGLYHNDKQVKQNGLFFCLRGTKVDGSNFVLSAIKNGAVAIVTEQEIQTPTCVTQVIVKNAREMMSLIACKFYSNPADKLKIIGVTGTNGKTTITNMLASCLETAGKKVSIIGTNGIYVCGKKFETNMTTPDPIELQNYLAYMVKNHIEYVCMEVSAHAIDLKKIVGIKFEVVVFTNLTQDHLDYFKTMDCYFKTKSILFQQKYAKIAVLNLDDNYSKILSERINMPYITYSINNKADYFASQIMVENNIQKFIVNNDYMINLGILGRFNISNAMATIATLSQFEISKNDIYSGFLRLKPVAGRFNVYEINKRIFIIDFAHSPDGLTNILKEARILAQNRILFAVFGCGGNRDQTKRKIMGQIAGDIADMVIITTDNPRNENANEIANQIASGVKNKNYEIIISRRNAIEFAYKNSVEGDVIVVAGKGAENYIEENGIKIPYSDYDEIMRLKDSYE